MFKTVKNCLLTFVIWIFICETINSTFFLFFSTKKSFQQIWKNNQLPSIYILSELFWFSESLEPIFFLSPAISLDNTPFQFFRPQITDFEIFKTIRICRFAIRNNPKIMLTSEKKLVRFVRYLSF